MKFTEAWSKIVSENSILKFTIVCLSTLTLFLGISSMKLALKDPIVVERSCFAKAANLGDGKRSSQEIESFLKEALSQRFDTALQSSLGYVSSDELTLRDKEQKDLQSRKLVQKVILNGVQIGEKGILVDLDRLISVGDIRSAFKFPVAVKIETISRSDVNPYGLILTEVKISSKEVK